MPTNPNSAGDPQYPHWVRKIFDSKFKCTRCGRLFTPDDINGLGVACPPEKHKVRTRPCGRIFADCPKCSKPFCFETHADKLQLLNAVELLFDLIELGQDHDLIDKPIPGSGLMDPWSDDDDDDDGSAPPSLPDSIQSPAPDEDVPFDFKAPEPAPGQYRREAKRHRRNRIDAEPPTDREVQVFLRALNRTSFKRSSKSYRQFMKRLGIDIHRTTEGDAHE